MSKPKIPQRSCSRRGCGGTMRPDWRTEFRDADGSAMVDTVCSKDCGMQGVEYFAWK